MSELTKRLWESDAASALTNEAAREIERLELALIRIAIRDRHYRVQKPKEDGGIRGPGGMIATYALMGVNGSYIGDAAILEAYPEHKAALEE